MTNAFYWGMPSPAEIAKASKGIDDELAQDRALARAAKSREATAREGRAVGADGDELPAEVAGGRL